VPVVRVRGFRAQRVVVGLVSEALRVWGEGAESVGRPNRGPRWQGR
jgi:hypothetical protein